MLSMNKEQNIDRVSYTNKDKPSSPYKELFTPTHKPFDLAKELRLFNIYIKNNKINVPITETTLALNDSITTDSIKPLEIIKDLEVNPLNNDKEMIGTSLQTNSFFSDDESHSYISNNTLEYSDDDDIANDDDDDVSHNSLFKGTSDVEYINQYILDIVQQDSLTKENNNSIKKTKDNIIVSIVYNITFKISSYISLSILILIFILKNRKII